MHLLCTNYVFSDLELNYKFWESSSLIRKITPHVQRELGKVIGVGSYPYNIKTYSNICLWTKSYFSNQLTFSNIHDRTSRRIYRLALPLRAPE